MAQSPFYNVIASKSGNDLTEYVSNFMFEDVAKQDNLIEFRINDATIDLIDGEDFKVGTEWVFTFGYLSGDRANKRVCTVKALDVYYAGNINVIVKCTDKGFILKKRVSVKVFEEMKASDIVQQIADEFGFETDIEPTETVRTIPVGGKTYHQFLKHLANKENYHLFVRDNKIYFKPQDLTKESERLFTYGDPDGGVKSFRPRNKQEFNSSKTSGFGIDKNNNQLFSFFGGMEESKMGSLGKKFVSYEANGNELKAKDTDGGNFIVEAADDQKDLLNRSLKKNDQEGLKSLEADLELEMDPDLEADKIITIAGVAKMHEGNWYVEKVTHTITGGGGLTKLKLKKNATNEGLSGDASDANNINNSVGNEQAKKEKIVTVVRYDANGNEIK